MIDILERPSNGPKRRLRQTRATPVTEWPAQALINAPPGVLARLSPKKLSAVARLWRKRWGWNARKRAERLEEVAVARRKQAEARSPEAKLRIARRPYQRSRLGPTEDEVVATIRAFLVPCA